VISSLQPPPTRVRGFRLKLLVAMMLLVFAVVAVALDFAERNLTANGERALQQEFQEGLAALHNLRDLRHVALVERCHALVRKPRIHAALEDNALDLLYPSAEEELRDVMEGGEASGDQPASALHAQFYRFIDSEGRVISPPNSRAVGPLTASEAAQLVLPGAPDRQQTGDLWRADGEANEVIATPIISNETGEVIATLVLGFKPLGFVGGNSNPGLQSGIWLKGQLHLPALGEAAQAALTREVSRAIANPGRDGSSLRVEIDGRPHLLFFQQLNPGSWFPPAYEVCIFPLETLLAREHQLRWQVLGIGALLLVVALVVSNFLAARLSAPVERLAEDSEENRALRVRAEAALELTSEELQRSARFSADASHQLKTPVTVLRAGLEELLMKENFNAEDSAEISALIHQTYRLSSLIEDLLLLSRMDAGRLKLEIGAVNLTQLIEASLDDLGAMPNEFDLKVETNFPPELYIAGEKRYTAMILQNLLENARKYNQPRGRIRIIARVEGEEIFLAIGNTGRPILPAAQARIFERFHRGSLGENVPGYGLGLNLARELARLHQGELRLAQADELWTEFEVRFRVAQPEPIAAGRIFP
jgi:signal transduction histidine kinase